MHGVRVCRVGSEALTRFDSETLKLRGQFSRGMCVNNEIRNHIYLVAANMAHSPWRFATVHSQWHAEAFDATAPYRAKTLRVRCPVAGFNDEDVGIKARP